MIFGIGNDIIEVNRIHANIKRYGKRFLDRVFTLNEQQYCMARKNYAIHFAGRFAAKESVVKALGTGFSAGIAWTDVEVINNEIGKPAIILSPHALAYYDHPKILITISHCEAYASAVAIWTS